MKKHQSQARRLLEFMKRNNTVTNMTAFSLFQITSFHRRLSDIKKFGVTIYSKWSDDEGTARCMIYGLKPFRK